MYGRRSRGRWWGVSFFTCTLFGDIEGVTLTCTPQQRGLSPVGPTLGRASSALASIYGVARLRDSSIGQYDNIIGIDLQTLLGHRKRCCKDCKAVITWYSVRWTSYKYTPSVLHLHLLLHEYMCVYVFAPPRRCLCLLRHVPDLPSESLPSLEWDS